MRFIESLKLAGLLSFPPDMEPFELESLNVLIGPNGSGKSNFIEAFELLRALPTDLSAALRRGGGAREWLWKGKRLTRNMQLELTLRPRGSHLRGDTIIDYALELEILEDRFFVSGEDISGPPMSGRGKNIVTHYRNYGLGLGAKVRERSGARFQYRELNSFDLSDDNSILSQLRDPVKYDVLNALHMSLSSIQIFQGWSLGRDAEFRRPQRTDLPGDRLLPDASNLAVIVNNLDSWGRRKEFNDLLKRFFPRVERLSTPVIGGTVQLLLHEKGFDTPIPATRISDGTLRFIAMLAVLLSPEPPPLVCIEEPELGLHPDAVALLGDVLEEASERMQLVVTTHSDALVSELTDRPSAIVACERPGAGTMLRRLDPEHVAHWLDEYALGDIWRMGALGANP